MFASVESPQGSSWPFFSLADIDTDLTSKSLMYEVAVTGCSIWSNEKDALLAHASALP
jgi:hypothetical protein